MEQFFYNLARQSLTAGWMILALLLLRPLLKKAPRAFSCLLWALAAVRLALPFSLESRVSLVPQQIAAPIRVTPIDPVYYNSPALQTGTPAGAQVVSQGISWREAVPYIWLIGVAAMAIYALISYLRLAKRVRIAVRIKDQVYLCDQVSSPFVLGIFRPKIYLPSDMRQPMTDHVLSHERAHLRRGDHIWKPLGYALLTVYWFNPLCWLAYILFCRDMEQACDEAVIKDMTPEGKKAYSAALLQCSMPRSAIAACPVAFGEISVKQRIQGVLNYRKPALWVVAASAVLCMVLAACFLTDPVKASTQEITLYSSPSEGARIVHQLDLGEDYTVLEKETIANRSWAYVECQDGKTRGWMLLDAEEAAQLQEVGAAVESPKPDADYITFSQETVVYSAPSLDSRELARYPAGMPVSLDHMEMVEGSIWGVMKYQDGQTLGWIPLTEPPESEAILSGTVTAETLNVRSGPGTMYSAVGYLKAGTKVIIFEVVTYENLQWGRIGINAWVNMAYIDSEEDASLDPSLTNPVKATPSNSEESYTFSQETNVYSSPSEQGRVVAQAAAGEICTITRREFIADGSWGFVQLQSGSQGWVHFVEEDEALAYFREYVDACSQPKTELVEPYLYFSTEYAREFFRVMYAPVTGWYPSGIFRVNDNLWGIEYRDSNSARMVYSFVGRMDGRLYVFQNVHQVPEALSENLEVSLYEEENAMYITEEYMECDSIIRRLLPFAQAKYVTIGGTKDYSDAAPCPIEDVICGTDTWRAVDEPSSYGSPGCIIWLTADDGSVATICDSSPVIVVSYKDGTQQWYQAAYTGEELVGMIYSWAKGLAE